MKINKFLTGLLVLILFNFYTISFANVNKDSIKLVIYRPFFFYGNMQKIKIYIGDKKIKVKTNRSYDVYFNPEIDKIYQKSYFKKRYAEIPNLSNNDAYIEIKYNIIYPLKKHKFIFVNKEIASQEIQKIEKKHQRNHIK